VTGSPGARRPAVAWSWSQAASGAVYALPAAAVALRDPQAAVPLALGVLPSALLPVPGPRRQRVAILFAGALVGASLFLGGVLAHLPVLLGAVLLLLAVTGAAVLSSVAPRGQVLLVLGVPLVAAGLSYGDYATSVETFWLMLVGATYSWLVSLLWPERAAGARPERSLPDRRAMLAYGVRMGVAAALAYLFADSLRLDHPGWAPAACLLVARPQLDLLQSRGVGRVVAVCVGALAAALVLRLEPRDGVYAALTVAILAATSATRSSRWYVTSAFTTFFVFLLLLFDHPDQAAQKLNERVGETVIGVALAYLFGWLLPWLLERRRSAGREHSGGRAGLGGRAGRA
jgi:hypothetical protein